MTDCRIEAAEKALEFFLTQYRDGNKNAVAIIWELQAEDPVFANELDRVLQAMFSGKDQRSAYDGAIERAVTRHLEGFYTTKDIRQWCREIDTVSGKEESRL